MTFDKHDHHKAAHAVIALLILIIIVILFDKFLTYQDLLFQDLNALREYVLLTIAAAAVLFGLLYLVSDSVQKHHARSKVKVSKPHKPAKKRKK